MDTTWDDLLHEMFYGAEERREILARAEEFAERKRISRNRLYAQEGLIPMFGVQVRQRDLADALTRVFRESGGTRRRWPLSGRALILSDRQYAQALALQYFLFSHSALNLPGVAYDAESAERLADGKPVDLLVIAGRLADRRNYELIDSLRQAYGAVPVLWAAPDLAAEIISKRYRITCVCDCRDPFPVLADCLARIMPA